MSMCVWGGGNNKSLNAIKCLGCLVHDTDKLRLRDYILE